MSAEMVRNAVAVKYEKRYDDETLRSSLGQLQAYNLISFENFATQKGLFVYRQLDRGKTGWAEKFFRKSNSPNVEARSPAVPTMPTAQKRHVFPAIPWLRPDTW